MSKFAKVKKEAVLGYLDGVKGVENLNSLFVSARNVFDQIKTELSHEYDLLASVGEELEESNRILSEKIASCQNRISELEETISRQEKAIDELQSELDDTDPIYRYTDSKGRDRERPNFDYINLEHKIYEKSNKVMANYARLELVVSELGEYVDIESRLNDISYELTLRKSALSDVRTYIDGLQDEYICICNDVIKQSSGVIPKLNKLLELIDSYISLRFKYLDDNRKVFRTKEAINPNAEFVRNGYKYQTDHLGRTVSVSGKLYLAPKTNRRMENVKAMWAGHKLETDDRGHIIAHQFGGSDKAENLFPQDFRINQNEYKKFEEDPLGAALENHQKVEVSFSLIYSGDSKRPDSLVVLYSIDGKRMFKQFTNESQEKVA